MTEEADFYFQNVSLVKNRSQQRNRSSFLNLLDKEKRQLLGFLQSIHYNELEAA